MYRYLYKTLGDGERHREADSRNIEKHKIKKFEPLPGVRDINHKYVYSREVKRNE